MKNPELGDIGVWNGKEWLIQEEYAKYLKQKIDTAIAEERERIVEELKPKKHHGYIKWKYVLMALNIIK